MYCDMLGKRHEYWGGGTFSGLWWSAWLMTIRTGLCKYIFLDLWKNLTLSLMMRSSNPCNSQSYACPLPCDERACSYKSGSFQVGWPAPFSLVAHRNHCIHSSTSQRKLSDSLRCWGTLQRFCSHASSARRARSNSCFWCKCFNCGPTYRWGWRSTRIIVLAWSLRHWWGMPCPGSMIWLVLFITCVELRSMSWSSVSMRMILGWMFLVSLWNLPFRGSMTGMQNSHPAEREPLLRADKAGG